jgi:hypothetical protein
MYIKDYGVNPLDGIRHEGRSEGLDPVPGGAVGYYHFPSLGIWQWLFIPEGSRGGYQNVRSPMNYDSLELAREAALSKFGHPV